MLTQAIDFLSTEKMVKNSELPQNLMFLIGIMFIYRTTF